MPNINNNFFQISSVNASKGLICHFCDQAEERNVSKEQQLDLVREMYYSREDLMNTFKSSVITCSSDSSFIKPCSCPEFYHEECLTRKFIYCLSVKCPFCYSVFPLRLKQRSLCKRLSVRKASVAGGLFIVLTATVFIVGFAVWDASDSYKFWKVIDYILSGLLMVGGLVLLANGLYNTVNDYSGTTLDYSLVKNLKVIDEKKKIIIQPTKKLIAEFSLGSNLPHTTETMLIEENGLTAEDIVIYKIKRNDRITHLQSKRKKNTLRYLEKYASATASKNQKKPASRWKTAEKIKSISIENLMNTEKKKPIRTSTVKNIIRLNSNNPEGFILPEIKENSESAISESGHNDSEKESSVKSYESRQLSISSSSCSKEFSDDKINEIFGLGHWRRDGTETKEGHNSLPTKYLKQNEMIKIEDEEVYEVHETKQALTVSKFKLS